MDGQIGSVEFWNVIFSSIFFCGFMSKLVDGTQKVAEVTILNQAVYAKDMWVMRLAGVGLDQMAPIIIQHLKHEGLVTADKCHQSVCDYVYERTQVASFK